MKDLRRLKHDFNKVDNITAICRYNSSPLRGEYPELEIGRCYKVTYFGVFRSRSDIMLEEFGYKEYNAGCFDLYEDDVPLDHWYTKDTKYMAPYLREMFYNISAHSARTEAEIPYSLKRVEKEFDIKILLAALSGSRAMGTESQLSDFDVNCVYVHKPEWYNGKDHDVEIQRVYRGDIDLYGWELGSALSGLASGDPTLLEWIQSPKLYYAEETFIRGIREVSLTYIRPEPAIARYIHNISMYNERFLGQGGRLKETLYYIRGVLSAIWVEQKKSLPPFNYLELLDGVDIDESVCGSVQRLIEDKKAGNKETGPISSRTLRFFRNQASEFYQQTKTIELQSVQGELPEDLKSLFQSALSLNKPGDSL